MDACAVIDAPDKPGDHVDHAIVMGVDWAKSEDYTVLTVGCRDCGRVVDWARMALIFDVRESAHYTVLSKMSKFDAEVVEDIIDLYF